MKIYNSMSITTINNDIYLTHYSNSIIYKIINEYGVLSIPEIIVGNRTYFGNRDGFNGKDALLKNPRNITKNSFENELYFIDNEKYIKNVKLIPDKAEGETLRGDLINISHNIYDNIGYTFTNSDINTQIYFVDFKKIYKINFNDIENIYESSSLNANQNFIGVSYYNDILYYCYETSDVITIKKRESVSGNLYDFQASDLNITLTHQFNKVYGFVYLNNQIILSGENAAGTFGLELFSNVTGDTYNHQNIIYDNRNYKIKSLIDYNAIFPEENTDYIIGRLSIREKYYKINVSAIVEGNIDELIDDLIKLKDDFKIFDVTKSANIIDENIIFSNRNYNLDDIAILYNNIITNKIEIIQYTYSEFRTSRVDLNSNFEYIQDIAVGLNDILYIADNITNTIYETDGDSNVTPFLENVNNIRAIKYSNNKLHYITNDSYNIIDRSGGEITILSNITDTDATDSLDLVTDISIDNNYEVGYISFEQRLKWFYL